MCVHQVHLLVLFWYFVERFPTVVHAKSSKLYPAQSYLCNLLRWWPGPYTRSDMGAFEELSRVTLSPKQRQVSKCYGTIMWPSRTTQIFSNNAWFDGLFYVDFTPTAICLWNSTWSKSALKRLATSAALIRRPRCPQKSTGQNRSVKFFYYLKVNNWRLNLSQSYICQQFHA